MDQESNLAKCKTWSWAKVSHAATGKTTWKSTPTEPWCQTKRPKIVLQLNLDWM